MAYPKGNGNTNEWCLQGVLNMEVLGAPLNSGIYKKLQGFTSHKVIIQTSGDMRTSNYAIWALYPVFLETNFQSLLLHRAFHRITLIINQQMHLHKISY